MFGYFARFSGICPLIILISLPIGLEEHINATRVLSQLNAGGNDPRNRRNRAPREVLVPTETPEAGLNMM